MDETWLLAMDMTQLLVTDEDWSLSMDEEKINHQPNLFINDFDTTKPCSGPTDFGLRQCCKQRTCKDIKKTVVNTKTANFKRICLCSVLNHEQMADLRLKGMVFINVNKPV